MLLFFKIKYSLSDEKHYNNDIKQKYYQKLR